MVSTPARFAATRNMLLTERWAKAGVANARKITGRGKDERGKAF
jgi:hypothetical protein